MKRWVIRWLTLIILFTSYRECFPQRQADKETRKLYSIEDPRYNSIIVARVGSHAITAQEFLLNYEFGPSFAKRENDSKRRYLNFMVYEKLLALDGYSRGVDASEEAKQMLDEITGDLATEELYKEDILKKVKVSGKSLQDGINKERVSLSVRWIYKRTKEEIVTQQRLLEDGISFDSLYSRQFTDSVKPDERSMETTKFHLEIQNPILARVLDTLAAGRISGAIPAPDGFYILKVVNVSLNSLTTESESMKAREDVRRALVQRRADSLSDRYVDQIIQGRQPAIVRRTFDILEARLAKNILSEQKYSEWKLNERLIDRWGSADYSLPDDSDTLVLLKGSVYRVHDFLRWFHAREYNLTLNSAAPELFFTSLEQLIWRMVRDRLLAERAYKRGFQRRDVVKKQLRWWNDKIVYKMVRSEIAESIKYSDDKLKAYFEEHKKNYRDTKGEPIAYDSAKDEVLKDYYSFELTKRSVHKILKLKEKYGVRINEKALNELYVDIEHDPRAIDVYAVKKGGVFPRPAFPT